MYKNKISYLNSYNIYKLKWKYLNIRPWSRFFDENSVHSNVYYTIPQLGVINYEMTESWHRLSVNKPKTLSFKSKVGKNRMRSLSSLKNNDLLIGFAEVQVHL